MTPFLYDVTDRSGNLVIGNATFAEVVESLNCSKAQANNARTSGDLIFRKYEMHRVDRKLSRVKDIALLQEFDTVRLHLLGYKKGDRKRNYSEKPWDGILRTV